MKMTKSALIFCFALCCVRSIEASGQIVPDPQFSRIAPGPSEAWSFLFQDLKGRLDDLKRDYPFDFTATSLRLQVPAGSCSGNTLEIWASQSEKEDAITEALNFRVCGANTETISVRRKGAGRQKSSLRGILRGNFAEPAKHEEVLVWSSRPYGSIQVIRTESASKVLINGTYPSGTDGGGSLQTYSVSFEETNSKTKILRSYQMAFSDSQNNLPIILTAEKSSEGESLLWGQSFSLNGQSINASTCQQITQGGFYGALQIFRQLSLQLSPVP